MKISVNKLLLAIGFLWLSTLSWAQTRVLTNEKGVKYTEFEYKTPNQSTSKNKYKGSVFWQDALAMGTFSVAGGDTFTKPVLLDLLHQHFIAYFEDKSLTVDNTDVTIGATSFRCIKGRFYQTLFDGKVKLLVNPVCSLKEYPKGYKDGVPVGGVDNDFSGEVERKSEYALLFSNHKLRPIQLSTYSVTVAFLREYDGLEYHIEQFGKKITNENDLIALLKFLEARDVF